MQRLLSGEARARVRELLFGVLVRRELRVDVAVDEVRGAADGGHRQDADDDDRGDEDGDPRLPGCSDSCVVPSVTPSRRAASGARGSTYFSRRRASSDVSGSLSLSASGIAARNSAAAAALFPAFSASLPSSRWLRAWTHLRPSSRERLLQVGLGVGAAERGARRAALVEPQRVLAEHPRPRVVGEAREPVGQEPLGVGRRGRRAATSIPISSQTSRLRGYRSRSVASCFSASSYRFSRL